jgi:A/G-specific adenine glycosylase
MQSELADGPSVGTFRKTLLAWGRRNRRVFPWRVTRDPYRVIIGELLLQRTRGENVVAVYDEMLRRWPTPAKLARARLATIANVIRPLGLAKRAPIIARFAKVLDAEFNGSVPSDPDLAQRLPGVGPYASRAVQVFARGRDLPLTDWLIARVLRRYFALPEGRRPNADTKLWDVASSLASDGRARDLWLSVLDLGAAICQPRPRCGICPLASSCAYAREGPNVPRTQLLSRAQAKVTPM